MLQIESILPNNDNTGIITGKIIHIYKSGYKKTFAKTTDTVLVAAQKTDYRKLQDKKITQALIIKTKKNQKRLNGHYIKFSKSGFVTLQEKNTFKATAIKGPIAAELRFHTIPNLITTAKTAV
jgi:large subunit ribosomal protein L14